MRRWRTGLPRVCFPRVCTFFADVVADVVSRIDFDPEEDRNSSGDDSGADSDDGGAGTEHYVDVG